MPMIGPANCPKCGSDMEIVSPATVAYFSLRTAGFANAIPSPVKVDGES
jgi:hypothetical protein